MGISNVAVKTFDSTGAQSLCRTNEYKGDEEVKSSFISKCQKMYISGSGETVIPGSLRQFPGLNSVDTFYVNSDTDAISDMVFSIEFRFKNPDPVANTGFLLASVSKDIILSIIDHVDIKLGSLTVQTLTADDIYIRNLTELGTPYNFHSPMGYPSEFAINGAASLSIGNPANIWQSSRPSAERGGNSNDIYVFQASCSLPFIGRNKDMSRALLQAGALTNAVTVKVHYNRLYQDITSATSSFQVITGTTELGALISGDHYLDLDYFKSYLKVRTHIMTDTEKKFISKNIIHKVLNTSSNVIKTIPRKLNIGVIDDKTSQIEVDLENVSHNVSHLLIAVRLPHVHNKSFSGSGNIPIVVAGASVGQINASTPFSTINASNAYYSSSYPFDLFGYIQCPIESMELVIGSDRTGFIKGSSAQLNTCENFDLKYTADNKAYYIISLAEKAFDTAGVAFSKSNNKKLIINLYDHIFSNGADLYMNNSLNSNDYEQSAIVTVTACGTKVQSVVGGSMSFL